MFFHFPNFTLDIYIEQTKNYYATAPLISKTCTCNACRNYEKAVDFFPKEVISFFSQFGIDMKKAVSEVYSLYAPEEDSVLYGGWYHVCGKIIAGKNSWVKISENFKICFHEKCDLLDDKFPLPAIQLDIEAVIPWVLAEKNDYYDPPNK